MRLDLISDDITFVTLKNNQLVEHHVLTGDFIVLKLQEPGITEELVLHWLTGFMKSAVEASDA